ncbi:MAG: glycosyltransferase family 2 protein [Deltaproteobacteria bacterium]|nr:glycosyltransferase family 2 protein [Deltaproteobacteria bacterium]
MVREVMTGDPSFLVFLPSFNRPRFAEALLRDLVAESAGRRVKIHFRDDCSDCDYSSVRAFAADHADVVVYERHAQNRARDGLWKTYNEIFAIARRENPDFLIVLQDHSNIVPGFFDELVRLWNAIPDGNKAVVNLPRDAKALHRWWSPVYPAVIEHGGLEFITSGWVDGSWFAGRRMWETMTDDLPPPGAPPPPGEPYRGHPTLFALASMIRAQGGTIYTPTKILATPARPLVTAPRSFRVFIPTYDRAENLHLLLTQLEREAVGFDVAVDVFDDASTRDYGCVEDWSRTAALPVTMHRNTTNRGKSGFWRTIDDTFRVMVNAPQDATVMLQDDAEICSGFFGALLDLWHAIGDERKIAMNIQHDTRGPGHIWQAKEATPWACGDRRLWLSGWFDGLWFGTRDTMEALSYHVHPVDPRRWDKDPLLSSGVGQQLTDRLNTAGYNIFMPDESLVRMIPCESHMNPESRMLHDIREVNFRGRDDG